MRMKKYDKVKLGVIKRTSLNETTEKIFPLNAKITYLSKYIHPSKTQ